MNVRNILLAAAAVSVVASAAFAQVQTATSDAVVLVPLAISNNGTTLSFGRIIRSSTASTSNTITVAASNADRAITGAGNGSLAGGTVSKANFTVTGTGANAITVSAPAFNLTRTGGSETLSVTPAVASTATLSAGTVDVPVGGAITIASDTLGGTYAGTLSVTFAYQ